MAAFIVPITIKTASVIAQVDCLIDTGAEMSTLPYSLVKKLNMLHRIRPYDATIGGVGGHSSAAGQIVLDITFNTTTAEVVNRIMNFVLIDSDDIPTLLGFMDMQYMNANINFAKNELQVECDSHKHIIPLLRQKFELNIRIKSTLSEHEKNIISRILDNLRKHPNEVKYQSLPLAAPAIAKLSIDAKCMLKEEGFVEVDHHLVYCQ